MAVIRNVVMRGASQRLGGVVFYTRAGETIARELAPSVSNPRTEVQMTQRVKLANVVSAYKANKAWMRGAFEDKPEKESDYNAFVRFNLTDSRVALTKSEAAAGSGIAAPYQVSSGSIPSIECSGRTTGVASNLYCGNLIITQATTVGQFSEAIMSNNNGIQRGMQLSLVVNIQRTRGEQVGAYIVARSYEVIIDETNTTALSEYFPFGILEVLDSDGGPLFFNGSELGNGAATFILSRTISGRLYVSSQRLQLYGDHSLYDFNCSANKVATAIASYGENQEMFLDSGRANKVRDVELLNYIQAVIFNQTMYANGATIPTDLRSGPQWSLYFSQEVAVGAEISLLAGEDEIEIPGSSINWNSTRTRANFQIPSDHTISAITDCLFQVTSGDTSLEFAFVADPTT